MNARILIKCALLLAISTLAGCGGGSEGSAKHIAQLDKDMVAIPGRNYAICKFEVTQALWFAVMGEIPSQFKGPDRPVENVSWNDCQEFCQKCEEHYIQTQQQQSFRIRKH